MRSFLTDLGENKLMLFKLHFLLNFKNALFTKGLTIYVLQVILTSGQIKW